MATYRTFVQQALDDFLSGLTIKALLVKEAYEYDEDAHEFLSDIDALGVEVTATGYSRQTLSFPSVEYDEEVGVYITGGNLNFGTFTQTGVLGPIFYIHTGSAATSRLICADVDGDAYDIYNALSAVYRIDPAQGFLIARL